MNIILVLVLIVISSGMSIFTTCVITKDMIKKEITASEDITNKVIADVISGALQQIDDKIKKSKSTKSTEVYCTLSQLEDLKRWCYNICTNSLYISKPSSRFDISCDGVPYEAAKDGLVNHISPMGGDDEHGML